MKLYRFFSLSCAIVFTIVGLIFLISANGVLTFFNSISGHLGMTLSPVQGYDFYLILAAGYMYLVALLAYFMYKQPASRDFPLLLANGKFASSVLSVGFFIFHQPYLIYLTNCIVDGLIGILALYFYFKIKKLNP
jgi:hypothetical protein